MSAFEPVLVIALGSALGDATVYPEVPILYARLIIVVMVGLDRLLGELQYRYKNINNFHSGIPRLMIRDGTILEESLHEGNLRSEINHACGNAGDLRHVAHRVVGFANHPGMSSVGPTRR